MHSFTIPDAIKTGTRFQDRTGLSGEVFPLIDSGGWLFQPGRPRANPSPERVRSFPLVQLYFAFSLLYRFCLNFRNFFQYSENLHSSYSIYLDCKCLNLRK